MLNYKRTNRLPMNVGYGFEDTILENVVEAVSKEVSKVKPKDIINVLTQQSPKQTTTEDIPDALLEKARMKLIKKMVGKGNCLKHNNKSRKIIHLL
jgi:hypothetical protein